MFGAHYAGIPPEQPRPERTVWASDTESRMKQIRVKIKALEAELHDASDRCNHTLPDGTSQLKYTDDGDGGWTRCTSCGTTIV